MYLLHLLEFEDLALIAISNLIVSFISGFSTLGIPTTVERFYYEWVEPKSKISTLWFLSSILSGFISLITFYIFLIFKISYLKLFFPIILY